MIYELFPHLPLSLSPVPEGHRTVPPSNQNADTLGYWAPPRPIALHTSRRKKRRREKKKEDRLADVSLSLSLAVPYPHPDGDFLKCNKIAMRFFTPRNFPLFFGLVKVSHWNLVYSSLSLSCSRSYNNTRTHVVSFLRILRCFTREFQIYSPGARV